MAFFRLVGSRQIWSFDFPVLLSFDSTKMKLLIHVVASWTGLITPVVSIFSIPCLEVCLRLTGMGLQGVCLDVMEGFVWIWYGSPGNQPMPSKSSGYCSLICSFDLTILIFFGVSSQHIMGLEVVIMDYEFEFGWTSCLPFAYWSLWSKKTLLMSTPKCLGAQIFRFTQVKLMINPPFETVRALSQLFAVQCHQWEPIQNSQLIRIYKEGNIPPPPFETARTQSELCTIQCDQSEPIRNSQLIRNI